jgi:endonuclease YncB( thermonuclease family)
VVGARSAKHRMRRRLTSADRLIGLAAVIGLAWILAGSGRSLWMPDAEPEAQATVTVHQSSARGVPIVQSGERFTCTPVRVWDGDGPIWCAEGPRIRLAGINAREVRWANGRMEDAGCNSGHPCPTVDGVSARDHLVSLIGTPHGVAPTGHILVQGEALSCASVGEGRGTRTAAWCSNSTAGDLNRAMVSDGHAVRWERYWRD